MMKLVELDKNEAAEELLRGMIGGWDDIPDNQIIVLHPLGKPELREAILRLISERNLEIRKKVVCQ